MALLPLQPERQKYHTASRHLFTPLNAAHAGKPPSGALRRRNLANTADSRRAWARA
jgi:hypothetical protein